MFTSERSYASEFELSSHQLPKRHLNIQPQLHIPDKKELPMKWTTPLLVQILLATFPAYKASKGAAQQKVLNDVKAQLQDEAKASGVQLPTPLEKVRRLS